MIHLTVSLETDRRKAGTRLHFPSIFRASVIDGFQFDFAAAAGTPSGAAVPIHGGQSMRVNLSSSDRGTSDLPAILMSFNSPVLTSSYSDVRPMPSAWQASFTEKAKRSACGAMCFTVMGIPRSWECFHICI